MRRRENIPAGKNPPADRLAKPVAPAGGADVLRRVLVILRLWYGPRRCPGRQEPVGMLVATILSQNTNDSNSSAGYERLRQRFTTWDAVADAPLGQVERCIRVSGLARTKAPRIQAILREVRRRRGRIELDFLADMGVDEAFATLTAFRGVGPKTALCTLLFALGRPVFPVDTHIFRIAHRLGVLAENVPPARAHEVLAPLIAPRDRYAMHVLLIALGRDVCKARIPRCAQCRILQLCPHGKRQLDRQWELG